MIIEEEVYEVRILDCNLNALDSAVGGYNEIADAINDDTFEDDFMIFIDNTETHEEIFTGLIHEARPFWSQFCI